MSALIQQIERARRRLLANALFERATIGVLVGGAALALAVLVDRAFGFGMPQLWGLAGAGALALGFTIVATVLARPTRLRAAIAIDAAAGLKERLSTALVCGPGSDEFAQAALRDAEKTAAKIHVPTHLPLRAPGLWPWSLATTAAAALLVLFMPTLNLFARDRAQAGGEDAAVLKERESVTAAVNQQLNRIRQMAQENKQLEGLASDLKPLELADRPLKTPDDVRREAVKQIDRVTQKLEQKKAEQNAEAQRELKRMLAGLKPQDARQPQSELSKALAQGNFEAAKQALDEMKKDLADAARKGDADAQKRLAELQKKLDDLAKELAKLPDDRQLRKELEKRAGLDAETAKKLLDELSKMDPKQLEKELQKKLAEAGAKLTPEQMQKLAEKIAQNKEAREACKNLAQAMQQAAQACKNPGESGASQDAQAQASAALEAAMGQLSDLEMAEQMMNELEAQLSELKNLRQGVCQGQGNRPGDKPGDEIGNQGPQYGQGYGARIGEEKAAHKTAPSKEKTHQVGGQIVGQMLIDGPQVKGEAQAEARAAVSAELRDATNAIERDEVPRQYERALRVYFERLAGLSRGPAGKGEREDAAPAEPK